MKKFLLLTYFIIFNVCALEAVSVDFLKIENVKDYKTTDWNNDGKQDMLVYFNDGRFGVLINNSKNDTEISFEPIRYISSAQINSGKPDTSIQPGKPVSTEKPISENRKQNQSEQQKTKNAEKLDTGSIQLPEIKNDKFNIYDVCVLNFINESDISRASEFEWMKTGIPDLIIFELENDARLKVMPRNIAAGLRPGNPKINSKLVISGSYKILANDIILTLSLNDGKKIKEMKFSGGNDTNGLLTVISAAGIELHKEIKSRK